MAHPKSWVYCFIQIASQTRKSPLLFNCSFIIESITEPEDLEIMEDIPNKRSTCPDEVPVKLIKQARYRLSQFLAKLINTSVLTETFPSNLKTANIIPVFKKRDERITRQIIGQSFC